MIKNRRERFLTVATTRTSKIIQLLKLLGNCSNKSNYDYTDEDIAKIFNALETELKLSERMFTKKQKNNIFQLESNINTEDNNA